MRTVTLLIIFLMLLSVKAQDSFRLTDGVTYAEIPFEQVANLIVVPAIFNGKATKFILDTGASHTLLFNWNNVDTLNINVKKTLKIKGYGEREFLDVFYTDDNHIKIGDSHNLKAETFVLVDEVIDMKPQLGVFVNGILGADFFKEQIVEINYNTSTLHIYKQLEQLPFSISKYEKNPMTLENSKPFIKGTLVNERSTMVANFLIDTGSSEALWLFRTDPTFEKPKKYFDDYLGFGLNGDIFGKRTKLDALQISTFNFRRISTSFPKLDQTSYKDATNATGSIGGEILRRFSVIFDYQNETIYLQKSKGYEDYFYFNMAGIQLRAGSLNLFTQITSSSRVADTQGPYGLIRDQVVITANRSQTYAYVPELFINHVRSNSVAHKAGLQIGDKIVGVNGLRNATLTMKAVNDVFYKDVNRTVQIQVERDGKVLKFKFKQEPLID